MRILIIHTYYQLWGGEDVTFEQECANLKKTDDVETLTFHNAGGLKGAFSFFFSIWNFVAAKRVREKIKAFKPDIVHVHNMHFAAGLAIIRAIHSMKVPVIVTLHNFRLLCPSVTLLRNGVIFMDSIQATFPWKAIRYKLYRKSYLQTFWLAFIVWVHGKWGTWKMVDRFIVPTKIVKDIYLQKPIFKQIGHKFLIKPHSIQLADAVVKKEKKNYYLFVGRLSEEKGIGMLLDTFERNGLELHIAGDGPLKEEVIQKTKLNNNIKYLGAASKQQVQALMSECTAFLFTSVLYETFGIVIIEAFACGCIVIASDMGSPLELVQAGFNGFHFKTGNAESLNLTIGLWEQKTEEEKDKMRDHATDSYNLFYTPDNNRKKLLGIYEEVISDSGSSRVVFN